MFGIDFLAKIKQNSFEQGYKQGIESGRIESRKQREQFHTQLTNSLIKTPVIILPNEWVDPIIGFVTHTADMGGTLVPYVHDVFRQKSMTCLTTPMSFSEQRMLALAKLDPFERWALFAKHAVGHETFIKAHRGEAKMGTEFINAIRGTPFWDQWVTYQQRGPTA